MHAATRSQPVTVPKALGRRTRTGFVASPVDVSPLAAVTTSDSVQPMPAALSPRVSNCCRPALLACGSVLKMKASSFPLRDATAVLFARSGSAGCA